MLLVQSTETQNVDSQPIFALVSGKTILKPLTPCGLDYLVELGGCHNVNMNTK